MTDATTVPPVVKKPFPEDRAIKLALAREKALEVRRRNAMLRRKEELERLNAKLEPAKAEEEEEQSEPPPVEEPCVEDTPTAPVANTPSVSDISEEPRAPKKKKAHTVVVEQSTDDEDEFQDTQRVLFVRRVRKKKEAAAPAPTPPQQLTAEQQQIQQLYNQMFSGGFQSVGFGRRR